MRNQDLISVASRCRVVTAFRNTQGLAGHLGSRLQPNHPTDDLRGIGAATIDGLLLGCGDAVIGVNPATDSVAQRRWRCWTCWRRCGCATTFRRRPVY